MSIGDSVRNWIWKGAEPHLENLAGVGAKLEGELNDLKKLMRRQGIQQESLVREISDKIDAQAATDKGAQQDLPAPPLTELADSFFHLEAVLVSLGAAADTLSALNMVWEKLADVCDQAGMEIIRESGVPYDSRLHEALNRAPLGDHPVVMHVSAPGFIHRGRVIRPARVVLSDDANLQALAAKSEQCI
ncbi:MAG: nucleotide exchange factor GrpE [Geobacteraceae bacterium GWC2_58_44]|nr:MAG: nucleotide exchange factor GrpE [Geobacteraceae bacterium GWC2_58_44]HBG07342.1 nucleotide exchange factor GrpE [Geobacter sp.]